MKTNPCAKINLGLYITERRTDGYHNIETVFYPIPLCDELEIAESEEDRLTLGGMPLEGDTKDNLVMRALRLLRKEGFPVPPLHINLVKNIPSGAGLGGGSSDATAVVKMTNEMFHLGLTPNKMEQLVSQLGADCPFFVRCQPVMAEGIGNLFTPLPNLSLTGHWLLLVKPDDFVSTREAYAQVTPQKPLHPLKESINRQISEWGKLITNDFEQSVFPNHPIISSIKATMLEEGATYAAMSGSGSSVFGIFGKKPDENIVSQFSHHFVFVGQL